MFARGLEASLREGGFSPEDRARLLAGADAPLFTRTHGRREVAYLNRAWEAVLQRDYALDPSRQEQPFLDLGINSLPTRCAAFSQPAGAADHLRRCLREGVPPPRP